MKRGSSRKRHERFPDNGWEEHGGYMKAKMQKLEIQSAVSDKTSEIFKGISIYVNGYTNPTSEELKKMVTMNGGVYQYYYLKSRVSHIIATNLPQSKIIHLKDEKVVRPQWIVDSIAAGKLLSHEPYLLYIPSTLNQQTKLSFVKKADTSSSLSQNLLKMQDLTFMSESKYSETLHNASVTCGTLATLEHPTSIEDLRNKSKPNILPDTCNITNAVQCNESTSYCELKKFEKENKLNICNEDCTNDDKDLVKLIINEGFKSLKVVSQNKPNEYLEDKEALNNAKALNDNCNLQFDNNNSYSSDGDSNKRDKKFEELLESLCSEDVSFQSQQEINKDDNFGDNKFVDLNEHTTNISNGDSKNSVGHHSNSIENSDFNKSNDETNANNLPSNLVSEFFKKSRLHYLSQWKLEAKSYVASLQQSYFNPNIKTGHIFHGKEKLISYKNEIVNINSAGKVEHLDDENLSTDNASDHNGKKLYAHIDLDCFFASVALLERPNLKGRPIAITHSKADQTSNNNQLSFSSKSDIACCNYEARKFGIRNGMLFGQAKNLCPNLIALPYDFEAYSKISKLFYDVILSYVLKVEAVSCDELYIDLTDLWKETNLSPLEIASVIRKNVLDVTGCACSCGLGGNMLVARLATKKAKPNGQHFVPHGSETEFMKDILIEDLPGVGYSLKNKLQSLGIYKCGDVSSKENKSILYNLKTTLGNKIGTRIFNQARGVDEKFIEIKSYNINMAGVGMDTNEAIAGRKSVSAEVNYGIRFSESKQSDDFLENLAKEVSKRLVCIGRKGTHLTLKVKVRSEGAPKESYKYLGHGICDNISRSSVLKLPTNEHQVISHVAKNLLKVMKVPVEDLRGIGIQMSSLHADHEHSNVQPTIATSALKPASISNATVVTPTKNKTNAITSDVPVMKGILKQTTFQSNNILRYATKTISKCDKQDEKTSLYRADDNIGGDIDSIEGADDDDDVCPLSMSLIDVETFNELPLDLQVEIKNALNRKSRNKIDKDNGTTLPTDNVVKTVTASDISNVKNNKLITKTLSENNTPTNTTNSNNYNTTVDNFDSNDKNCNKFTSTITTNVDTNIIKLFEFNNHHVDQDENMTHLKEGCSHWSDDDDDGNDGNDDKDVTFTAAISDEDEDDLSDFVIDEKKIIKSHKSNNNNSNSNTTTINNNNVKEKKSVSTNNCNSTADENNTNNKNIKENNSKTNTHNTKDMLDVTKVPTKVSNDFIYHNANGTNTIQLDESFLAAMPEDIKKELINEQVQQHRMVNKMQNQHHRASSNQTPTKKPFIIEKKRGPKKKNFQQNKQLANFKIDIGNSPLKKNTSFNDENKASSDAVNAENIDNNINNNNNNVDDNLFNNKDNAFINSNFMKDNNFSSNYLTISHDPDPMVYLDHEYEHDHQVPRGVDNLQTDVQPVLVEEENYFCKFDNIHDVKKNIKMWVEFSNVPNEYDMDHFKDYLKVLMHSQDLQRVFLILRFIQRLQNINTVWKEKFKEIVSSVQDIVQSSFRGKLKLIPSF